jgi:hypothetical protein
LPYIQDIDLRPHYVFWTIEANNFICNLFIAVGMRAYVDAFAKALRALHSEGFKLMLVIPKLDFGHLTGRIMSASEAAKRTMR